MQLFKRKLNQEQLLRSFSNTIQTGRECNAPQNAIYRKEKKIKMPFSESRFTVLLPVLPRSTEFLSRGLKKKVALSPYLKTVVANCWHSAARALFLLWIAWSSASLAFSRLFRQPVRRRLSSRSHAAFQPRKVLTRLPRSDHRRLRACLGSFGLQQV
jgi:hypothetical protein